MNQLDSSTGAGADDASINHGFDKVQSSSFMQSSEQNKNLSLLSLRRMKCELSPSYEKAKDVLLTKNVVFRHWRRRDQHLMKKE